MNLAAIILSVVSLLIAGVALGLAILLHRRRGVEPHPSLSEQLMGMTREEFDKFKKEPESYGFYPLSTIFTEFKKVLATTQQESARHAKERPKIAYGERSTYAIQNLEVMLKGRMGYFSDRDDASSDMHVTFVGQPEEMSEFRFTISTVPPRRTVSGASIFFSLNRLQLTPDREVKIEPNPLQVTLTACDENGNFLYNHRIDVTLYQCAGGGQGPDADTPQSDSQQVFTNSQGKVVVSFDGPNNPGTYRIHAILRDADAVLKEDNYYFEAVRSGN